MRKFKILGYNWWVNQYGSYHTTVFIGAFMYAKKDNKQKEKSRCSVNAKQCLTYQ